MKRTFAKWLSPRISKTAPRPRRRRLGFERMEPRQMLASFFVNGATGSDANPGTAGLPFATIQKGVDAADGAAGADTVFVYSGLYKEHVTVADDDPLTIK